MRVTDEWLYEKMPIVDAAMVKRLEDDIDKEYVFSDKFIRHMNRLIKREKYMYSTKILKKIVQRVAVIVIVMLMGTFTVTMSVEACRIHFFHTIKTIFDGKISIYSYELEKGNISDAILNPRYLPDGYQLVEEHRTDTSSVMKYSRADENLIFNQKIISNEKMIFDMSFDCMEQIAINGMTVSVYWYRDDTFWAYGEYGNSIYVLAGDKIEKDDIEKIYKHWIW